MEWGVVLTDAERDGELTTSDAKAASQDAMSLGPSVVNQVGPSSGVPFR